MRNCIQTVEMLAVAIRQVMFVYALKNKFDKSIIRKKFLWRNYYYYYSYHLYSFTVPVVIVHCLKTPTHALCFKIHIKTQSLFKTLECLRLLCQPTCFGHTLDHLQGMFLVQCCFPPCCFVTILLGYVAVSSVI